MVQLKTITQLENPTFEIEVPIVANAGAVDQAFFLSQVPCKVIGISYIHATAGTGSGSVNVQVTKDTGTDAPGAGTDLLTNNTNAGFDCKGTANTVQTGALVTTTAVNLAAGDRLSLDFAGTLTSLAGVLVSVRLQYS